MNRIASFATSVTLATLAVTALALSLLACGADTTAGTGTGDTATLATGSASGGDTSDNADVQPSPPDAPAPTFEPLANVFESNPVDSPTTIEVELQHLTAADHSLAGLYADVKNCLRDDNATPRTVNLGFPATVIACTPSYTALPGEDMTYLHIEVPQDHGATEDSFAEVMMYHHMQLIHDYYKGTHGLTDLDFPLQAFVNIQAKIDLGLCNEWTSIGNAAFIPKEAGGFMGIDFANGEDSIIFGQTSNKDFSYDADVIYHEYTHAMVGATRLTAIFPDPIGLNNLPGALNEAYADFFAGTLAGDSVVGNYALNDVSPQEVCGVPLGQGGSNLSRDMSTMHVCPDDLTGEVHADGEIFSSALWAIRDALGPEKADKVILGAMAGFTQNTDFGLAANATFYEAKNTLGSDDAALVEKAFTDRGIIGCNRRVPAERVGARGLPLQALGTEAFGLNPYGDYVPGYLQFGVDLPEGVTELRIRMKPQAGGFGGGGGGIKAAMAIKPGPQPIYYSVGSGGSNDAFNTVPFENPGAGVWEARMAGSCLSAGPWTFAIHNKGNSFQIPALEVVISTDPVTDPNFDAPCGL